MKLTELHVGLGGGRLLQVANRSRTQMMSYVIDTPDGHTVVIDGGYHKGDDGRYLHDLLKSRGGQVDLWMITHSHCDHFGALLWMLQNIRPFDLTIGRLCFSFPPADWISLVEPAKPWEDEAEDQRAFLAGLEEANILPQPLEGTLECGGMTFEVLNDAFPYEKYHNVNATTRAIRAHFPRRDVLFLGDLDRESEQDALACGGPEKWRCDIVQMAHHGQSGVSRAFYEVVQPKICLWCAPDWLWECDNGGGRGSGPWKTLETRQWMEELGAEVHCPLAWGDFLLD